MTCPPLTSMMVQTSIQSWKLDDTPLSYHDNYTHNTHSQIGAWQVHGVKTANLLYSTLIIVKTQRKIDNYPLTAKRCRKIPCRILLGPYCSSVQRIDPGRIAIKGLTAVNNKGKQTNFSSGRILCGTISFKRDHNQVHSDQFVIHITFIFSK